LTSHGVYNGITLFGTTLGPRCGPLHFLCL